MTQFTLYNDDCLNVLKTLDDNSIDSCVTDPPYGLSFMGKSWDYDVPSADIWREVLRVLKPGGHLLAFFGSRTYHRGVIQIEDAGFEIRDQIMWLYGSGFPKSHNIAKDLNKKAGVEFDVKPASGVGFMNAEGDKGYNVTKNQMIQKGESTDKAKQWEGWGTALKPAHEPIVVARKPITEKNIADNVLKYGTGALNIDATRIGDKKRVPGSLSKTENKVFGKGLGSYRQDGTESGHNPNIGRWPANLIHDGSDDVVGNFPESKGALAPVKGTEKSTTGQNGIYGHFDRVASPPLRNDSGSASRFFYCAKASKSDRDEGLEQFLAKKIVTFQTGGGASGKASSLSANRNTEYRNNHPTVKPTELMKYLIKLVTQKNGTILDPFMGSGTTGKACGFEGFKFVGIERDADYFEIAKARIEHAYQNKTVNLENFFE